MRYFFLTTFVHSKSLQVGLFYINGIQIKVVDDSGIQYGCFQVNKQLPNPESTERKFKKT